MGLRHAVLAALLDGAATGYELSKNFDVGMAEFWHARRQQLYAELTKLEQAGLVSGREIIQQGRPNKRVQSLTEAGRAELAEFAATPSDPQFLRDDLLVKAYAVDVTDGSALIDQLAQRAEQSQIKIARLDRVLARLSGNDEDAFLADAERIGPYLTAVRGRMFEEETIRWCTWAMQVLRKRQGGTPDN
ncbi:PadR family transcriptional regulator [Nocardia sp. NBC_00565]|uniref:PadR family transcriptional regulator n=1 Tax=Nocardia sp. NBC_00565 TaxID=2975993 RepID=UPI002E81045B|nr:PadR family transcriptional regulator [Nocardia sp. NBC_00565]WUC00149.1 PadR family transcriptional regulator [Nocardia sp. NBC_00565]